MLQFWLFIFIAILNAFDGLATAYGLHLDLVEEQNPLALYLWEIHPFLFIGSKIFCSLILLFFPFYTSKEIWKKKTWTVVLIVLTIVYIFVNIVHIVWLVIYFDIMHFNFFQF